MKHLSALLSYRLERHDKPELIDGPGVGEAELLGNLRDLSLVNRAAGGVWLTLWAFERFVQSVQTNGGAALVVLDVGSGLGDIPRALRRWSRRRGHHVQVIATDLSPQIVRLAAVETDENGSDIRSGVAYATADGLRLPFDDRSVDLAMCSLTLHHFAPEAAVALLRELRRVARQGVIVNDIVRSWPGLAGAWFLGRLLSRNRLTRHDGLVSVRRAYTPDELRVLAQQAGLHVLNARGLLGYRLVLSLR